MIDIKCFISKYLQIFFRKYFSYANFCQVIRVSAKGLGDRGSILSRVIPKSQKMVLDAALLNTQHYKVRIKG